MTQVALQVSEPELIDDRRAPSGLARLGRRIARPVRAMRAVPRHGTYLGTLVAVIGMVLIAVAWGKTAGQTNVALQIPHLVATGMSGLALVAIGLSIISMDAKRTDARERMRQSAELRDLLAELRRTVESDSRETETER
jgi:hypothetical protein